MEIKRGFGFNAQDLSSIHVMRQTIHIYIYKVKIKDYRAHQDKIDFVKCSKYPSANVSQFQKLPDILKILQSSKYTFDM